MLNSNTSGSASSVDPLLLQIPLLQDQNNPPKENSILDTPSNLLFDRFSENSHIIPHINDRSDDSRHHRPQPNFPTFSGEDVYRWLYRLEQLLDYFNIIAEQRVKMAVLYLENAPLAWYKWRVRTKEGFLT